LLIFGFMFRIILQRFRRRTRTLSVLSVLMLAMVLRGLVPAGYMPDLEAGRQGNPLFAFCSPDSSGIPDALSALWSDIDAGTDSDGGAMAGSCAFCVLGKLAMDVPETGALSVVPVSFAARPVTAASNVALPVPAPRGPPLGSRAPPFFIA